MNEQIAQRELRLARMAERRTRREADDATIAQLTGQAGYCEASFAVMRWEQAQRRVDAALAQYDAMMARTYPTGGEL